MTKLAWCSDVHLDCVKGGALAVVRFGERLKATGADIVLVTGDIARAGSVASCLAILHQESGLPILFVLGNHDFWDGSFESVGVELRRLHEKHPGIIFLDETSYVSLDDDVALVGHSGWYDGKLGDYWGARSQMRDWLLVRDFTALWGPENYRYDREWPFQMSDGFKTRMLPLIVARAAASATHVESGIRKAIADGARRVIVGTHVPPWKEATWHQGAHSDAASLPWYANKTLGDAILDVAGEHPDVEVHVLCGHSHGCGFSRVAPNVDVSTAGAEYGAPEIQGVWGTAASCWSHACAP